MNGTWEIIALLSTKDVSPVIEFFATDNRRRSINNKGGIHNRDVFQVHQHGKNQILSKHTLTSMRKMKLRWALLAGGRDRH